MIETSDLSQYGTNKLRLILRGVKLVIKDEEASIEARKDMLNGEDLSETFELHQREQIIKHKTNLEDLYAIKIAMITHLKISSNEERTSNQ